MSSCSSACPTLRFADWQRGVPRAPPARGSGPRSSSKASGFRRVSQNSADIPLRAGAEGCIGWSSRFPSRRRPARRRRASRHAPTAHSHRSMRWTVRRISSRSKSQTVLPPVPSAPAHKSRPPPACYRCSKVKAWDSGAAPGQTPGSGRSPPFLWASRGRQIPDGPFPDPAIPASCGRIPGRRFPVR